MLKSEKVELRRRGPSGGDSMCSDEEGEAREAPRSRETSSMVIERRKVCPGGPAGEPEAGAMLEGNEKDVVVARGEVGRPGGGDRFCWAGCGGEDISRPGRVSMTTCPRKTRHLGRWRQTM